MKIDLILGGKQVDLGHEIDLVLNKQFADLEDLTSIIVDYSKTIKVPMTPNNNEVFNFVYKLNHNVLLGSEFVDYDPSQKIDMKLQFNGVLAMEGYAVLNSVDLNGKQYEINIYGKLGKIFSDLKEKQISSYRKGNTAMFDNVKMNKETIKTSFAAQTRNDLSYNSTNWTDFFGFAPQLYGKTDVLETKSYVCVSSYIDFSTDIAKGRWGINAQSSDEDKQKAEDYASVLVGDGLDFNQYGEIRSYMTRPYVYVDKLVQLVTNEVNGDTDGIYDGYKFELDESWFVKSNPFYSKLCFFPQNERVFEDSSTTDDHVIMTDDMLYILPSLNDSSPAKIVPTTSSSQLSDYSCSIDRTTGLIKFTSNDGSSETDISIKVSSGDGGITIKTYETYNGVIWEHSAPTDGSKIHFAYYNCGSTLPFRYIKVLDESGNELAVLPLVTDSHWYSYNKISSTNVSYGTRNITYERIKAALVKKYSNYVDYNTVNEYNEFGYYSGEVYKIIKHRDFTFNSALFNASGIRFELCCDKYTFNTSYDATLVQSNIKFSSIIEQPFVKRLSNEYGNMGYDFVWSLAVGYPSNYDLYESNNRSNSTCNIYEILGEDFNPFLWFINYCKRYRLLFDIDYATKKIKVTNNYFNSVIMKDMVVDYDKDFKIEPIVEKYKYVSYGYEDNNSKKGKLYRRKFGIGNYGDTKIDTAIDIDGSSLDIKPFEKESVFIPTDGVALTYNNMKSTDKIRYSNLFGTSHIINTLNSSGEIEYFDFFAFRMANATVTDCYLSDDSATEMFSTKYALHRYSDMEVCTSMPQFDNWLSIIWAKNEASEPVDSRPVVMAPARGEIEDDESDDAASVPGRLPIDTSTSNGTEIKLPGGDTIRLPQTIYWDTFVQPKEIYSGALPSGTISKTYTTYNLRWEKWLNELFNVNNKKVTCYVRMSYPEFINFKFNTLFVIEGSLFLVNKIIDFNPNSDNPTKVELIQISNINNLK